MTIIIADRARDLVGLRAQAPDLLWMVSVRDEKVLLARSSSSFMHLWFLISFHYQNYGYSVVESTLKASYLMSDWLHCTTQKWSIIVYVLLHMLFDVEAEGSVRCYDFWGEFIGSIQ